MIYWNKINPTALPKGEVIAISQHTRITAVGNLCLKEISGSTHIVCEVNYVDDRDERHYEVVTHWIEPLEILFDD